jgi:poly-gamma-glutamate capsule biosynthesis protein CapA/YwtB (metallophosphatase superfamily)
MFSPVIYPQLVPAPRPKPSVREMAAAGYFRAIALWLNEPLADQGIFVKVQADRPGCLKLTVEFERPPIKERLLRFLCHRIWVLNSELIEGIYVVARPVGQRRVAWAKRIRINTPAVKQRQAAVKVAHPARHNSPLPPKLRQKVARLSTQHLKTLRLCMVTGSAVAAFVLGCLMEMFISGPAPMLPTFSAWSSPSAEESDNRSRSARPGQGYDPAVTSIDYRASDSGQPSETAATNLPTGSAPNRPTVVDAVLEPVGVIQHHLPEGQHSDDVTLLFGGDVDFENLAYDELAEAGGLFSEVEEYGQADLSMITLGSPLATAATTLEEELYDRNRPDAVNLLAESGVDIVNLTNDALMEYGSRGLEETLTTLDSKGLYRVGAGRNETEARRPEVIDVKGKRIAYLSYSMGGDNSAFEDRAGTNAQDMKEIVEDIQALRDQVDWIVVNYRWMDVLTKEPNFKQTNLARMAIDQGADVVVGYHPNVIQGAEVYKGRPIAYSVGDFVFETETPAADQDSAMLKVSLRQDQMKVEFVPVRVKDALPKTLKDSEGKAILQEIEQASQQFEQPMTSSMVLDLKDKTPVVPEEYDPDSPFVSPEEAETLTIPEEQSVEEPKADDLKPPTDAEAPDAETPDAETPAPAKEAEPTAPAPSSNDDEPAPEVLDLLEELEELDDGLDQWGPKPSDGQQEFRPIPQELQDSKQEEVDARANPGILRLLNQTPQGSQEAASAPEPAELSNSAPAPEPVVAQAVLAQEIADGADVPEAAANPIPDAQPTVQPESQTAAVPLESTVPTPEPALEAPSSRPKVEARKQTQKQPVQSALLSQLAPEVTRENVPVADFENVDSPETP